MLSVRSGPIHGHGLPPFPKLIFLDTNIVQNLSSFGEFIYDTALTPNLASKLESLGERFGEDIYALADFVALGHRAGWPIALSSRTLTELRGVGQPKKRLRLINWGERLTDYFTSSFVESHDVVEESSYRELTHFTCIQRRRLSDLLASLPQDVDRQLIVDAREFGCDIFLTMDYRTIWKYRDEISQVGLRAMRPVELLEHVRPWAGLLR